MAKKHKRARIERLLGRRKREGLTFLDLSRQSGVPSATLAWWSRKLERESSGGLTQTHSVLVPVDVVDEPEQPLDSVIEVVARGGLRIFIPPTASDLHVRRVLLALSAC